MGCHIAHRVIPHVPADQATGQSNADGETSASLSEVWGGVEGAGIQAD